MTDNRDIQTDCAQKLAQLLLDAFYVGQADYEDPYIHCHEITNVVLDGNFSFIKIARHLLKHTPISL